ncbi:hypothetical protein KPL76_01605 [Subtercola sp. PAMC28395]|uniref:hypothetical protein n=1 Tax=Subtercola sp. PAMC28395 TaxID=2846775 RepID=UPI001C0C1CE4|nr:hypothetical protein [Subtercola sp. PAMC28395]QWT24157.1 hypothetical protein KPL76_01605 [Subtercola sp. PAMC28395]
MSVLIHGVRKADSDGIVEDFWFVSEQSRIVATGIGDRWRSQYGNVADQHDMPGRIVTPGFIDIWWRIFVRRRPVYNPNGPGNASRTQHYPNGDLFRFWRPSGNA